MGAVYHKSGDPDKAAASFEKSIELYRNPGITDNSKDDSPLADLLLNVGYFYLEGGELESASRYFEEAADVYQEVNNKNRFTYVRGNQGILNYRLGNYDLAENYLLEAIEGMKADGNYEPIAEYQAYLAEIYKEKGDYRNAHNQATESLKLAQRLGMRDQISKSSLLLARIDEDLNNFKEANAHLNLHMQYKDSMDVEMVDMTRFELEKTEREKAQLEAEKLKSELELANQELKQKRQRTFLWAMAATALLLILIAVGSYRRYRFIKNTNEIISRERDRSDTLLQNILPKQTAMELKKMGRVRAQRFDNVTVLFTDFKGFTTHAESMDPEKLVESIDYYFSHFDTIMDKYDLEKIKTVGDAYMCASGLPFASADHASRVTEAALEILEFVENAKKDASKDQVRFDVRIGINSGPVVAGVVGTKKFAYDIWGDTVNIASRMESASDIGKINIAENTYELIKDQFECRYRGNIEVKNRGKLDMYFVLAKKAQVKSA